MKNKSNLLGRLDVKAFTLIELLVVVLIIGILAAVALPQYQKAVYKSRYAVIKPLARAIADAQEMYYLANGRYSTSFDELSIDLPAGGSPSGYGSDAYEYPWGRCVLSIGDTEQVVFCENTNIHMRIQIYYRHSPAWGGISLCMVTGTSYADPVQNAICKADTGKNNYGTQISNSYTIWSY